MRMSREVKPGETRALSPGTRPVEAGAEGAGESD